MFKEVTFSYTILSDPEKRRQYDAAGFEVKYHFCGFLHFRKATMFRCVTAVLWDSDELGS